jgi:2-(1,2-epoxy-1,2-dihydrophenyl)acetyl-CoA isomerase
MDANASSEKAVTVTRREGAAWIELNRPDALNAWDTRLGDDLHAAVAEVGADDEVRAVVVTGAGRAFSSGADLKAGFDANESGKPDVYSRLTEVYHPIITGIRRMEKPVIAAVNGPAVGIGCSLALACDLVVASESSYLLLAFVNIGLVPDGGSSVFIPARVGFTRAAELAARFATGPTRSFAGTKRQLNQSVYAHMDDQLELEAQIQQEMAGSADFVEGVTAFVQKRTARFTGR